MMLYGMVDSTHLIRYASEACEIVSGVQPYQQLERRYDLLLLLETAAQETHLGQAADRTVFGAGTGLCQIDPIGLMDVQQRTPNILKAKIKTAIGCDIEDIQHRDLAFSPALSFLVCRLHYRLRPGNIPDTLDGRAAYWKKWYNTALGKGTEEEYVRNAKRLLWPLLKPLEHYRAIE